LRYPNAIWVPGPIEKTGWRGGGQGARINVKGGVAHSAVGSRFGLRAVLFNEGQWYDASWQFTLFQSGLVEQHYDDDMWCWHAQGANIFAWGGEHEGGPEGNTSEPLTPAQLKSSIDLFRWNSEVRGFRLERGNGLWEHNQFASKPCPSGRIPWHLYVPLVWSPGVTLPTPGEDDNMPDPRMTDDEVNAMKIVAHYWETLPALITWREEVVPVIDGTLNMARANADKLQQMARAVPADTTELEQELDVLKGEINGIQERFDAISNAANVPDDGP
jgi:hypothetical protein